MRLLAALGALAIIIGVYLFLTRAEPSLAAPAGLARVGTPAPDFTLKSLQGNEVTLSQYRGKVVFLNFWATWCPPCRLEMPSIERLHQVYGDRGLIVLAVNLEEESETVRNFLKKNSHSFEVLLDSDARAQRQYGIYRLPETFLIDRNGTIVEHYFGARDWSAVDFLAKIKSMLEE